MQLDTLWEKRARWVTKEVAEHVPFLEIVINILLLSIFIALSFVSLVFGQIQMTIDDHGE